MNYPWICERCGRPFDESDWDVEKCPECGGAIVDADECPNCGEPIIAGEEMFCPDCADELFTPAMAVAAARGCADVQPVWINGFLAKLFTPEEINAILAAAITDDKKSRRKAREYAEEFDAEGYLEAAVAGEKKEVAA